MTVNIRKIRLYISYPFAAALAAAMLFDKSGRSACCVLAAAIHEAAHIALIRAFKGSGVEVCLCISDLRIIDLDSSIRPDHKNVLISLFGPIVNIALYFLLKSLGIFGMFAECNLALGLFNAVPLPSFDGGRALYILLRTRFSEHTSIAVLRYIAFGVLAALYGIAVYIAVSTGYNYSLLIICAYLTLLLFFKKDCCV